VTEETAPQEAPEDFDLDAWLTDAKRPERSVTVYKRADLIADLDELERQIDNAQRAGAEEEALSGGAQSVEAEYLAKLQEFHDSALVIRVRGLTNEEMTSIHSEGKKAKENQTQIGRRLIEAALVYPRINREGLERLSKAIGDAQMTQIVNAYQLATMQAPVVTVPFSLRSSGRDDTQE
jgi:hypothetical protein